MSSYQGIRLYFLFLSTVYLSYDLTRGDVTQTRSHAIWLSGYKVFFLLAALTSVTSYVSLELNTLLESTTRLQWSALATTSKSDVLALYREERLSDPASVDARYSKEAFGHCEQILFNPHDQYNPAPDFWCSFTVFSVLYNTAHLALAPLSYTSPLFFGAPAYVLYWGAMRMTQIMSR